MLEMIAHAVITTLIGPQTKDSIAAAVNGSSGSIRYILFSNDDQFYYASYVGPSNTKPGHVWAVTYDALGFDTRDEGSVRTDQGTLSLWGWNYQGDTPLFTEVLAYIGYAIHIYGGRFLWFGDVQLGPYSGAETTDTAEDRRIQREEAKKAQEEAKRAQQIAEQRRQQREQAQRELEERRRQQAIAEARRKAKEEAERAIEENRRQAAIAEARRKAQEAAERAVEENRRKAEELARQKEEEEAEERRRAREEAQAAAGIRTTRYYYPTTSSDDDDDDDPRPEDFGIYT